MKENKFLFYGCVAAIIVCAAWVHFRTPIDIGFAYDESEITEMTDALEFFVDEFDDAESDAEPDEVSLAPANDLTPDSATAVAGGEFAGCSAHFKSQTWSKDNDGRSVDKYYSTNTITCDCVYGDEIIRKHETYQYNAAPDSAELDCDAKCAEICAE